MAVNRLNCLFNRAQHRWRFCTTTFQAFLDNLLLPRPLLDAFGIGLGPTRQIFERGKDALEFRVEIFVAGLGQIFQRKLQNVAVGPRRDWKNVIEIIQGE